ncbi:MAG: beta-ketoacyl-[acyl-carrier-protein] synthase II [Gemmataceae bacterium]|nr:beta-ketoacyl-[acyl-carrier-protein] synthase II [Gemmataceae bacterium]
MTRRVVITGMGTVTPLAIDVPTYWTRLLAGQSGIGFIEQIDTKEFKVHIGGEVKNWTPEKVFDTKAVRRMDRFSQFAMVAAVEAWRDSGLDIGKEDPFRCGTIVGSGIGGLTEYEEQHTKFMQGGGPRGVSPFVVPKMMLNAAPGNISIHFGLCGPSRAVATACASSGDAITDALRTIQLDEADVMITGGSEAAITYMGLGGFISARALSSRNDAPQAASRPFDKDRDGFVLSEGAGLLVVEEFEHARRRGATIYAELLGTGNTSDAYNITAPHPEGIGATRAMQLALKDAKLNPTDIDYVNAHGTSTELGDAVETLAVKKVFGEHAKKLAISSTKSMIGHLLGASGGAELIATILSIRDGVVHPTINLDTPDPACDLDYVPKTARKMTVRYALSNSFGFGGHNASLVVGAMR